ncbi:MAG: HDOD domain-containing protein [Lamprobacter sp.]|uniref:sensor domain-containing diguanylate cyclase n=1 Tax=Lamprobacter sp. TaxID=3100796 RepID=UPI002B256932|nr:HDOD domain-containing protein [Lamprobacter sp.]MEA3639978.1 HDOD domain-containing protein [Lamprobacter sp.]
MAEDVVGANPQTQSIVHQALRCPVGALQPAPAAALKLLQVTRSENTGLDEIAQLIETEPALAAKVLKLVNSAYYGFPQRIPSIHRAATLLGLSTLRQATLHLFFYESMIQSDTKRAFDRLFFWQHSLLVAILSRGIAERLGHEDPDELYAAGLLHDLGKVILESHGKLSYSEFLSTAGTSGKATGDDERLFFGIAHDRLGALLSETWGLPDVVCRAQALHHCGLAESHLERPQAQEVAIVALADFIAWTQGLGSVRTYTSPSLAPEVLELIELEQLGLADLLSTADQEMTEIATFYGLRFPSPLQLRANVVTTALALVNASQSATHPVGRQPIKSATAPHQSLSPDVFVPQTLRALQQEFALSHLLLMQVEPKRRRFVATHGLPELPQGGQPPGVQIVFDRLAGDLILCLRKRTAVMIHDTPPNHRFLSLLGASVAAAIPVMSQGRLQGIICLYDPESQRPPEPSVLHEIQGVAGELGIALERSRLFAMERAKAEIDALTRLPNRSAVDRFLQEAFAQLSSGRHFGIGLVDIDHFKAFNDTFGHQTGDDVLRIVADTMRGLTRPGDFLGRYGGEEFLFGLMSPSESGAASYAERIRREIARRGRMLEARFSGHPLSVSIGIAHSSHGYVDTKSFVAAADKALYTAKSSGRNRVCAAWTQGTAAGAH